MNARLGGTGSVALAAVLFVAVNLIANNTLTSWRLDLTEESVYTLSPGTRNILTGIREPVRLRLFFSARGLAGIPQLQSYGLRVRDLLEEYAAAAEGGIVLEVIDPEPFSEAEDLAVAYGLRQIALGAPGEYGYLGLVGTNSTDDERVIPFFNPAEEARLEYALSKLVYQLAHPRRPVVGVLSPLRLFGTPPNALRGTPARPAWTIIRWLREQYEVRDLGRNARTIGDDIDVLMVVHPKDLTAYTRYAIDQYVLKGGRALVFVDPYSEADPTLPDPTTPMVLPERSSDLPKLLAAWGVKLRENAVAGDLEAAARIGYQGPRGPAETDYLPYLRLGPRNFNREDFVTAGLNGVNMAFAGVIDPVDEDDTDGITTLIHTGPLANTLNREGILFVRDPARLLDDFTPGNRELALAVRIRRPAQTAFPHGRPLGEDEKRAPPDQDFVSASQGPINVVLVADSDLLSDRFWVQQQEVMGVRVPAPFADNGSFVVNAVDHLAGNDDLISLRSRGRSARPFERVVHLQRAAEARFRDREQQLRERLQETEDKLEALQRRGQRDGELLSAEERRTLEEFRQQQLAIRKELRQVQRDLRRDIERLGTWLKLVNIVAVPLAIGVLALTVVAVRRLRRRPPAARGA